MARSCPVSPQLPIMSVGLSLSCTLEYRSSLLNRRNEDELLCGSKGFVLYCPAALTFFWPLAPPQKVRAAKRRKKRRIVARPLLCIGQPFFSLRLSLSHHTAPLLQSNTGLQRCQKMSSSKRSDPVTSFALATPLFNKLAGKRVVLASSSPRRKDILASVVSDRLISFSI